MLGSNRGLLIYRTKAGVSAATSAGVSGKAHKAKCPEVPRAVQRHEGARARVFGISTGLKDSPRVAVGWTRTGSRRRALQCDLSESLAQAPPARVRRFRRGVAPTARIHCSRQRCHPPAGAETCSQPFRSFRNAWPPMQANPERLAASLPSDGSDTTLSDGPGRPARRASFWRALASRPSQ